MNSSGIKRGLAATAIAALAVTGIPALASPAHAAVGVTVANLSAYDLDEFTTGGDDIVVTVKDGATPIDIDVEYDFAFTPEVGPAVPADGVYQPGGDTGPDGIVDLTFDPALAGSYTVTVRTVGTHIAAPAFTFVAGEAEITWADGVSARSPQNGSDTYAGTLALTNDAATPLSGRTVSASYVSAGNAILSPLLTDTNATGDFTFGLTDQPAPVAPETGTLTADTTFTPASDLAVSFEPTPVVSDIIVTPRDVFGADEVGPGKPVELMVQVLEKNGTAVTTDDEALDDVPVSFTVDKGFLTPDTRAGNAAITPDNLALTADQDDKGDLFGFYQSLGLDEVVDTSDHLSTAQTPAGNAAGIVATIEKDAGFNDDGLVDQKVTVTAGGVTKTVDITYDVTDYLNLTAAAFRKDGGSTRVPGAVDLKLYAVDQYVNLVGDQFARLSDDTPVARVVGEGGGTGTSTDFVNDNPSARASSSQPVVQTVTARINADENLVDANGELAVSAPTSTTLVGKITLNWANRPGSRTPIVAKLTGKNNGGKADRLTVVTSRKAAGATVKLFRVISGRPVPAGTTTLGANGRASFTKADTNGNAFTKYVAKVSRTSDTKGDRTNKRNLR